MSHYFYQGDFMKKTLLSSLLAFHLCASDYSAVENTINNSTSLAISGSFCAYDFNGDGTLASNDWVYTSFSDNNTYQLLGTEASDANIFGWLSANVSVSTPSFYMLRYGNEALDWLVFTTDGKSVYKLDGANSDNTFKYSSKLDITFNVSSDGRSVTPIKSTTASNYTTTSNASTKNVQSQLSALAQSHEESSDYTLGSAYSIELANNAITSNADVSITNSSVTITKGGTYSISGTLDNGQVIINTEESVTLILNNAHITSATSAPIYVENAQKTIIYVAPNTTNSLTDSANSDQKGTLMSKDNLSLYGSGILTINANINDGLRSNDGLIIKDTKLIINSVDDGIRGKDYIIIDSANITVNSVGDTIKSDNEEESDKGYIYIKDGIFNLTSQSGDGITAQSDLLIEQGNFTLKTGGGSNTVLSEDISAKGLRVRSISSLMAGRLI